MQSNEYANLFHQLESCDFTKKPTTEKLVFSIIGKKEKSKSRHPFIL